MSTAELNVYGGDIIETTDGTVGMVVSTKYSLRGLETVYRLGSREDSTSLDDTGPEVAHSQVVRIVKHHRHDYRPNRASRGHCGICDAPKAGHEVSRYTAEKMARAGR